MTPNPLQPVDKCAINEASREGATNTRPALDDPLLEPGGHPLPPIYPRPESMQGERLENGFRHISDIAQNLVQRIADEGAQK